MCREGTDVLTLDRLLTALARGQEDQQPGSWDAPADILLVLDCSANLAALTPSAHDVIGHSEKRGHLSGFPEWPWVAHNWRKLGYPRQHLLSTRYFVHRWFGHAVAPFTNTLPHMRHMDHMSYT